jgi:hypothetical protein
MVVLEVSCKRVNSQKRFPERKLLRDPRGIIENHCRPGKAFLGLSAPVASCILIPVNALGTIHMYTRNNKHTSNPLP